MNITDRLKQASRVVRTLHQAIAYVLVSAPGLVLILDLPADKVAQVSAATVAGLAFVARIYNAIFPAAPPLDENPLD